jgi:hypothetical protein
MTIFTKKRQNTHCALFSHYPRHTLGSSLEQYVRGTLKITPKAFLDCQTLDLFVWPVAE